MELLRRLTEIPGASSDEGAISEFILKHVDENQADWKRRPTVLAGGEWHDNVVLIFGQPRTAIWAHTDTVGFTVGHGNRLIEIGSPRPGQRTTIVGEDSQGQIETTAENSTATGRQIEPGTILTYKPAFEETDENVHSPYLDNRLGVFAALSIAKTLTDGAIVFGTYEEHGGNAAAALARILKETYDVRQALILDATWATEHVRLGNGTAVSLRDGSIPRRSYLRRVLKIARNSGVDFQLEVQSVGGSDGTQLQASELLIDWCFVGPPTEGAHTPRETANKHDIDCTVELYRQLMEKL